MQVFWTLSKYGGMKLYLELSLKLKKINGTWAVKGIKMKGIIMKIGKPQKSLYLQTLRSDFDNFLLAYRMFSVTLRFEGEGKIKVHSFSIILN